MLYSIKALLTSIVDYAGIFPPARLPLPQAMTYYARYQQQNYAWMLSRFILPITCLEEFEQLRTAFPATQWYLSLTLSSNLESDLERVRMLFQKNIALQALEFPPLPAEAIARLIPNLPKGIEHYFEIPIHAIESYLNVIQDTEIRVKIRTGGITENAFPSSVDLCQGIATLAQAKIPFKATAGLHHPLRSQYPLTYEPGSPVGWMYGFLNLAIAATFLYHKKISRAIALEILESTDLTSFRLTEETISWKGNELAIDQIEAARRSCFCSFGSCSFEEPVGDLQRLGLL